METEFANTYSFGEWLKQRRKQLKLTQREVAESAFCSIAMVKKIEADERQPSVELADGLADILQIPADQQSIFIECARGKRPLDELAVDKGKETIEPSLPPPAESALPSGTVTFLLTDIESSTHLWDSNPELMKAVLADHDAIMRQAIEGNNGVLIKTTGDGWHAVFQSAPDAMQAALAAQQSLLSQTNLKVRMALHTGTAEQRDGDYFGQALNRVARVMAVGHGGQILATAATAALIQNHLPKDAQLTNLGHHRLKDLAQMEEIFQLNAAYLPGEFPLLRSQRSSNLPAPATPFIGRTEELKTITNQLRREDVRLVTLVGPGGMGKTRLALEAAKVVEIDFVNGVLFVNLTAVTEADQIPDAIAHSLRLQLAGDADSQIINYLRSRTMLLVLDNCEQVIGEGLTWLSELLAEAPGIKLLVTSRERLNLVEERNFPVPEMDQALDLFIQAARRVQPDFDGEAEAASVRHICQLVGNLPLAVELAASWTPIMTCQQIADQIKQDLGILTTNLRNVPERHRNIESLFEYSWKLLSDNEKDVLMRLSVFQGGWSLEEGTAVAGANLLLLRGLVDKSLVRMDKSGRYDMHPLIHQFGSNKLAATEMEGETRQRHAEAFLALSDMISLIIIEDPILVLHRLELEHDNFRSALSWVLETEQMSIAYRLANQLYPFWFERGYRNEAIHWLTTIIDQAGDDDDPALCEIIIQLVPCLILQSRFAEAVPYYRRATAMANRLEDPLLLAMSSVGRSGFANDFEQAEAAFRQALFFMEQVPSNPRVFFQTGMIHGLFGDLLRENGLYQEAEEQYKKSLALIGKEAHGFRNWLLPSGNLGRLALQDGRLREAHEAFANCVAQARKTKSRMPLADWLLRLGETWLYLGNLEKAARCLEENIILSQEMGNPHSQADALVTLGQVKMMQGDFESANQAVQDGFKLYQQINVQKEAAEMTGSRLLKPELVDSFWRAGLVALAQGENKQAALLFGKADASQLLINHVPVPPLQEQITAGLTRLRNTLHDADFKDFYQQGVEMPLDETFLLILNFVRIS